MQLMNAKNLKKSLTAATCTLLGSTAQANLLTDWDFDTALMYYGETNRVSATEGIIAANKDFRNDRLLNFKLVFDSLTGASANGAVAQPNAQTFTTTSGKIQTPSKSSDIPLDPSFKDTRVQASAQWTQPLFKDQTISVGGNLSKESDYLSVGANSNIAFDFNQKNTTLSLGFSGSFDQVKPHGGIHQALSLKSNNVAALSGITGSDDEDSVYQVVDQTIIATKDNKTNADLLVGLTQVINKRMLVQLNYSYSKVNGYMTDPYKILSEINSNGETQSYRFENRPDKRTKQAFYAESKYHFSRSIMDLSYRYMTDDWNIKSHTFDFHYQFLLPQGHYVEPHVRYYSQTAADFYQPYLVDGAAIPEFASADYRLGDLDTYTIGVKYGMPIGHGESVAFRVEYYKQSSKNPGFATPGVLADEPVFQGIDAIVAQVSYSF
jgi:hypothetical protein